jgi:type I site-specific restriction endonuclease
MPFNEADTRAKLIDPAITKVGWQGEKGEKVPGEKVPGTFSPFSPN